MLRDLLAPHSRRLSERENEPSALDYASGDDERNARHAREGSPTVGRPSGLCRFRERGRGLGLGQRERLADVAVEQVDVRRQRERRRVVPEPALDLHGVAARGEQQRRAGVAERVEARPTARPPPRRPASARRGAGCRCISGSPLLAGNTRSPRPATPCPCGVRAARDELVVERHLAAAVPALRRPSDPSRCARRTLTCGSEPSSCRCRHCSAIASLTPQTVAASSRKNSRCSGMQPRARRELLACSAPGPPRRLRSRFGRCGGAAVRRARVGANQSLVHGGRQARAQRANVVADGRVRERHPPVRVLLRRRGPRLLAEPADELAPRGAA